MTSSEESTGSVGIRTAMLADFAKVEKSGLITIVGGGITKFGAATLPAPFNFYVVLQLTNDAAIPVQRALAVEIRRPAGDSALTINGELGLHPGHDLINIGLSLGTIVDMVGRWVVSVQVGEDEASTELGFIAELNPTA